MPNGERPSLKTLQDAIAALENQYGSVEPALLDRARHKATLKFLGSLQELVHAFCLQGCEDEDECGYIPFSLR